MEELCLTKAVIVRGMGFVCRGDGTEDFSSLQSLFDVSFLRRDFDYVVQGSWNNQDITKGVQPKFALKENLKRGQMFRDSKPFFFYPFFHRSCPYCRLCHLDHSVDEQWLHLQQWICSNQPAKQKGTIVLLLGAISTCFTIFPKKIHKLIWN